jgi:hypothetical protein
MMMPKAKTMQISRPTYIPTDISGIFALAQCAILTITKLTVITPDHQNIFRAVSLFVHYYLRIQKDIHNLVSS